MQPDNQPITTMPPSKKKSKEQKLKEKRENEKLRYQKIMSDPILRAEQQMKEREKYKKKREKKIRKVKGEMTKREHRQMKKKWNEWNENRRNRKQREKQAEEYLNQHSPPDSIDGDVTPRNLPLPPPANYNVMNYIPELAADRASPQMRNPSPEAVAGLGSSRTESLKKVGRKKVVRNRTKLYKENEALKLRLKEMTTKMERYKKQAYRAALQHNPSSSLQNPSFSTKSPRTKVDQLLKTADKEQIRRRLIFSESMTTAFKEAATHKKTARALRFLINNMGNLRKYKLLSFNRTFRRLAYARRQRRNSLSDSKLTKINTALRKVVTDFFERDDVSRMCPGKKETITLKKIKKQKRYLLDSLQNLHKKFLASSSVKLSYSALCSLRPFWVLIPKEKDRETCLCATHENFSLLVEALHKSNVLKSKDPKLLISEICCEHPKSACFYRECPDCEDKSVLFGSFDGAVEVTYFAWKRKEESFVDKKTGKTRLIKKVKKEQLRGNLYNVVQEFLGSIDGFLQHEGNLRHQHSAISNLKRRLGPNKCLIHADFSENYSTKQFREVQSFHFGGSREQYTLHTVVVYYRRNEYSPVIHKSICTISKCLEHGAAAIWTHLAPVFDFLNRETSSIETVHFLTDGPSSQYKNKTIFFLFCSALKVHFEKLKSATWNYHESGHGKGAADGVGGFLKRTADRIVSQGRDIIDFETFVKLLQDNTRRILVQTIDEDEIEKTKQCIPAQIAGFSGTMKVHQVVYDHERPEELQMKSLSCFSCLNCSTYLLRVHKPSATYPREVTREESELPLNCILTTPCEENDTTNPGNDENLPAAEYINTTSSSRSAGLDVSGDSFTPNVLKEPEVNDYVLVRFFGKKKFVFYVGKVTSKYSATDYDVDFLKKRNDYFVYPPIKDVSSVSFGDIVMTLPNPESRSRGRFSFPNIGLDSFHIK